MVRNGSNLPAERQVVASGELDVSVLVESDTHPGGEVSCIGGGAVLTGRRRSGSGPRSTASS